MYIIIVCINPLSTFNAVLVKISATLRNLTNSEVYLEE